MCANKIILILLKIYAQWHSLQNLRGKKYEGRWKRGKGGRRKKEEEEFLRKKENGPQSGK